MNYYNNTNICNVQNVYADVFYGSSDIPVSHLASKVDIKNPGQWSLTSGIVHFSQ